jgi:tetratricopeptide (TPR) repeat protein
MARDLSLSLQRSVLMPFHIGVFGNGSVYLTPPADVPNGTRAYVYILAEGEDPISFYRRLVMIEPQDPRLYTQLGLAQMAAGRLADAEASLSRATQLDFAFAEAHFNLGRCYEKQGQLDSAAHAYRAAVDLAPEEATPQRHLILALLRLNRPDEALGVLGEALLAVPKLREWAETDDALAPLREDDRWDDMLAGPDEDT